MTIAEVLIKLEEDGLIDSTCQTCREVFIPQLQEGKTLGQIFAPRHQASRRCESGKRAHCTCDTCF